MEQNGVNTNRQFFPGVKGKLGFGLMRLPMLGKEVDMEQTKNMVDLFMQNGFHYFDTAHGYISGQSEIAAREAIVKRYPRDSFILTNKLSGGFIEKAEDVLPLFQTQLDACGVEYFDFYLLHAVGKENYGKFTDCRAFEQIAALKQEGRVRHFGISFHDSADFLDKVLTEHPEIEAVQLQLNYLDWDDDHVQSRKCYEVCVNHGKPVIVMEPVKGGALSRLNEEANAVFDALRRSGGNSNAGYAMRFAAGLDNVCMVLSGMSELSQMQDNLSVMLLQTPLSETEFKAVKQVRDIFAAIELIPCTACRYCTDGCPMEIRIPDIFNALNRYTKFSDPWQIFHYNEHLTKDGGKASGCIGCGQCSSVCPQHLDIPALLAKAAEAFETTQSS